MVRVGFLETQGNRHGPQACVDVLDRLLALNHYHHQ